MAQLVGLVSFELRPAASSVRESRAAELEKLGVTVIDLSRIDDSSSGSHSKFAGAPEVVRLMGTGLNSAGRFGDGSGPDLEQILAGVPIRILGN